MSRSAKLSTLLWAAAKLAVVLLVVGSSASRLQASCGDYLEHRQIGKNNNPLDLPNKHERGKRCEGGECNRAPAPLPVDPLSLRVTVRDISTVAASDFNVEESEKEEWSLVVHAKPNSVSYGVPLKPPIL